MKGRFERGGGAILPNNITEHGQEVLLKATLGVDSPGVFYLCLCDCTPSEALQIEDLNEPTIGVGGYARIPIPLTPEGWPESAVVAGVFSLLSLPCEFTPTDDGFDKPVGRLALVTDETAVAGNFVVCVSTAFGPEELTPDTPAPDRTFRYRLFAK